MPKSKKVDPIKQREKRAKIAAGAGCVLLLAVMAYEIPSVMNMSKAAPPPRHSTASTTSTATPTDSAAPSTGLTGTGQLADTDVPPANASGQLVSFSVFESKNPFKPQVLRNSEQVSAPSTPSGSTGTSAGVAPSADAPPATATITTTPPTSATTTPTVVPAAPTMPTVTTPVTAAPPTATITVNGVASHVGVQGTFPRSGPVFRLVSFDADSAEIGIVGGSYASGGATLTLHLHQPVTLANQTDGKRYRLELVAAR